MVLIYPVLMNQSAELAVISTDSLDADVASNILMISLIWKISCKIVSDLRSETKGSWLESCCWLCAEVSSLQ